VLMPELVAAIAIEGELSSSRWKSMLGGTWPIGCDDQLIVAELTPMSPPKLVFDVVW
jgi:hypothetical protein